MGWTLEDAARMLDLKDGSTVAKHEIGSVMPSVDTMNRYEKLTGGEVTWSDFSEARDLFRKSPDRARKKIGARKLPERAAD